MSTNKSPETWGECFLMLIGGALFLGGGVALVHFLNVGGYIMVGFFLPIFAGAILLFGGLAGAFGLLRRRGASEG